MSDEVKPTLEDLTECWCGYKAPHARELMLHQLYCDPHNTAPKVIDDQRERIADLEAQLAAAQADAGFWGRATAKAKQEVRRLVEVLEEAKELLLQAHEPDQGQLRTQWDRDVDEWIKKAAQAEITRLREGRKIHNCEAAEEQISALEKDAGLLDWLADHEAVKNINGVNLSIYETAMCIAYERDVDAEPTVEDYRLALRLMIRTAINAEAAQAARGSDEYKDYYR